MLLSCCFREPKKEKDKKKRKREKKSQEDGSGKSPLLETPHNRKGSETGVFTVHGATVRSSHGGSDTKLPQERHPPSKEAKKLLKQKSQESLRSSRSRSIQENSNIPFIDQSSVASDVDNRSIDHRKSDTSTVDCRKVSLPSPPKTPQDVRRQSYHAVPETTPLCAPALLQQKSSPEFPQQPYYSTPSEEKFSSVQLHSTVTSTTAISTLKTSNSSSRSESSGSKQNSVIEIVTPQEFAIKEEVIEDRNIKLEHSDVQSSFSNESVSRQNSAQLDTEDEIEQVPSFSRGMQRSKGFHDASLLETQIKENEARVMEEKRLEEEEILIKQREAEDKLREDLQVKHTAELEKLQQANEELIAKLEGDFKAQLLQLEEDHKKSIEVAVINVKNEANCTISQLNKQIVSERAKLVTEQQQNSQNLEEEFRLKEERLQISIKQADEHEQAWQDEKAEVLAEVQRLKAEAGKMVEILAMEMEKENLSEDKKRCLTAEVYGLQLVVEMRTGEVKNLREQLAKATRGLEDYEATKTKLRNTEARLDDLQEQLSQKNEIERQLSHEKSQLENTVSMSSKAVERMSQNVEELQWRIRNNFDVPIHTYQETGQPQSLPTFPTFHERPTFEHCPQSTPLPVDKPIQIPVQHITTSSQSKKNSFFSVSREMMEATTTVITEEVTCKEKIADDATSDFSPSSDTEGRDNLGEGISAVCPEEMISKSTTENDVRVWSDNNLENLNDDSDNSESDIEEVDSLDEGLGDTSSENEATVSPSPAEVSNVTEQKCSSDLVTKCSNQSESSEIVTNSSTNDPTVTASPSQLPDRRKFLELQLSTESFVSPPQLPESEPPLSSPVKSPAEERMPSRITFETPL